MNTNPTGMGTSREKEFARVNTLLALAFADEQENRPKKALKRLNECLRSDLPIDAVALVLGNRGNVLLALHREDEALDSYLEAVANANDISLAIGPLRNALRVLYSRNQWHAAYSTCRLAYVRFEGDQRIAVEYAQALWTVDRFGLMVDVAHKAYLEALETSSPHEDALKQLYDRGVNHLRRIAPAAEAEIDTSSQTAKDKSAWRSLVVFYINSGQNEKAIEACDRAIDAFSTWSGALEYKAFSLHALGRLDDARAICNRLLQQGENSSASYALRTMEEEEWVSSLFERSRERRK